MTRIGIVVTRSYPSADPHRDAVPLVEALIRRGAHAERLVWHDEAVDWASFDLVVLRSPWDYTQRPAEFDAWLDRAGSLTRVLNEPALVRWNMDKRYLDELAQAGVAVVPTSSHRREDSLAGALASFQGSPQADAAGGAAEAADGTHVVLKPSVSAGAQLTGLFRAEDPAALELGRAILAGGGTVLLQPEIPELTRGREKALYAVDGHFTHAISKGALLARGGGLLGGVYREHAVVAETSPREREFAETVLSAISEVTALTTPLYARIDTVDSAQHGLVLLEAELFEPLFNLHLVPEVTEIFAEAILRRA